MISLTLTFFFTSFFCVGRADEERERDGETERDRDRERERDRETETEKEKETERQRQRERETESSAVKISGQRPTHISVYATVLLVIKTFILKYYDEMT